MASRRPKPLPVAIVSTDRAALIALRQVSGYAPSDPELSIDALTELEHQLRMIEEVDHLAQINAAAVRGQRDDLRWALHDRMLRVKTVVKAQYGEDSDAIQALGLKKKCDYRRRARRNNSTA